MTQIIIITIIVIVIISIVNVGVVIIVVMAINIRMKTLLICSKGQDSAAREALEWLRGTNRVDQVFASNHLSPINTFLSLPISSLIL